MSKRISRGAQPLLVQPGAFGLDEHTAQTGQWRAVPVVEGGMQEIRGGDRLPGRVPCPRLRDPALEDAEVQGVIRDLGLVSVGGRDEDARDLTRVPPRLQHLAQPRLVGLAEHALAHGYRGTARMPMGRGDRQVLPLDLRLEATELRRCRHTSA